MSYIGNQPATSFETVQKQISTSNSGTTITLDRAVTSVQDILLTIDAVVQSYDNYSVSGTTLTVGGTLSNNRVEILYVGRTMQSVNPTDDSVSASSIKTDAVTTAKIQNDAVTKDKVDFVTDSGGASLEAKGSSGYDGAIRLNCSVNSHFTELKSASHGSYSGNLNFTLPSSTGTNGQFLQTNGSGVLSFADAGGGLVYVGGGSTTSDVTNITIDNVFTSTYKNYLIVGEYTGDGGGAAARFKFRTGGSSGSDLTASEYNYHFIRFNADSDSTNNHKATGNTYCGWTPPVDTDVQRVGVRFSWTVFDPYTSGRRTSLSGTGRGVATDANSFFSSGSCDYKGTDSITGIKFYLDSGNVAKADINVYGIVDS